MPAEASTVGQYLAEWLQLQRSQLQPSTWESYRGNVENYLTPALGEVVLHELTAAQLTGFYAELQRSGGVRSGQPLALRTVAYCHGVIHKALADALRFEILTRNVAGNATLPKVDHRADNNADIQVWTAEQVRTFLHHTRGSPHHSLWAVAAATGLRRGELLGLRWTDLDLGAGLVTVRRALSVVKGQARLKQPKTSRCRTLHVDAFTTVVFAGLRDTQEVERRGAQTWSNDWDLVFTRPDGRHLDPLQITHAFRIAVRAAPVPRIRLHDLRHTHATLLHLPGVASAASLGGLCDWCAAGLSGLRGFAAAG